MARAHNFSAGPAVLPLPVIEQIQAALPELGNSGLGLMEISHRSAAFDEVIASARARMRKLMAVPDDYEVLFLQGGASLQFYMSALNITAPGDATDFILTGSWTNKAIKEARRLCDAQAIWDCKETVYDRLPKPGDYTVRDEAVYVYYTSNNTIYGTQWGAPPATDKPIICDASSDICWGPVDVGAHAMIFAGAQKNLGPSGVTAVILSPWAVERSRTVGQARAGGLPSMLDYGLMVDKGSMFNTPNTFGIFALERVLAWIEDKGGLAAMREHNIKKANILYDEVARTDFWKPHAQADARSMMNVTWTIANRDLEPVFVKEATAAGLNNLKGHRSVGGLRASIYNACPVESIETLVAFMQEFERIRG